MPSRRTFLIAGTGALAASVAGCDAGGRDATPTSAPPAPADPAATPASSPVPASAKAAADWLARSTAAGVVVAYDFSVPPANGGTFKWGSLKASPKVTCFQQNDSSYGQYVVIDNIIVPPGSTACLRYDVPDCPTSGIAERGDLWWISIDNYADQFGENSEFWVQWRTRMDVTYATFLFADRNAQPSYTGYKQLMIGEGMQPTLPGADPRWPHGYEGVGTSIAKNHISYIRVDFEGETNLIGTISRDNSYAPYYGFKYPSMYHGKPGYVSLDTKGTDSSWYTQHNSGNEAQHPAACEYQIGGAGYRDKSTCFIYPVDQWFTMMVHVVLGPRGHGLSSLGMSYRNIAASRIAPNQILLINDNYVEHFNPSAANGMHIAVKGKLTGSIDALVTVKDNATYPGKALLTLAGLSGAIQEEALQVDEYENGFTNSTIEYYAAYTGGAMQLLHRRTGVVMRVGNYPVGPGAGYTGTAKYGTFAWTTFMTAKSLTQTHPVAKVWVGQIIIKSGSVAPATPAS
jgi:hypothetical protein